MPYYSPVLSKNYSQAEDYFSVASAAVTQMIQQTGAPVFHEESTTSGHRFSLMDRGVIIRHLVLPGHRADSLAILEWIGNNLPTNQLLISLLSQYTPYHPDLEYPQLNRKVTSFEYDSVVEKAMDLGLAQGFMQKKSSAREEYTPPFNLEGLS